MRLFLMVFMIAVQAAAFSSNPFSRLKNSWVIPWVPGIRNTTRLFNISRRLQRPSLQE